MRKKLVALSMAVLMLAVCVIGGTLAYFTDTTDAKVNTFEVGNVDIDLTETEWDQSAKHILMPGKSFKKNPTITVANDSQDAYVFLEMTINKYNSLLGVMAADASADKDIAFTIFNADGTVKGEFKNEGGQFSTSKFVAELAKPANNDLLNKIVAKWFTGIDPTKWAVKFYDMGTVNKNLLTIRFAYIGEDDILTAGESVTFMEKFGMPVSVTQEMIDAGKTVGKQGSTFNTDSAAFKMTFTAYAIQAAEIDDIDAAYEALFPTAETSAFAD